MNPFTKQFWVYLGTTVGAAALHVVVPPLQTFISHHPVVYTVAATIWAALGAVIQPKKPSAN